MLYIPTLPEAAVILCGLLVAACMAVFTIDTVRQINRRENGDD